jgi:FdhE protein
MVHEALEQIDRLIAQRPAAAEALGLYREIVGVLAQSKPRVPETPLEEHADLKQKEGFPLFARESLPVDFSAASDLLCRILEQMEKTARPDREGIQLALKKARDTADWSAELLTAFLRQETDSLERMAGELGLVPAVLAFVAHMALYPSLEALRERVAPGLGNDAWKQRYCPICGSPPDMACFDSRGKRYLHCGLCGQEWAFRRLQCPFCGNEDHDHLGYFQAEEEEGFRVDFCRKCNRYIKVVDRRSFEEPVPLELENLATLHLDILAGEHGFR